MFLARWQMKTLSLMKHRTLALMAAVILLSTIGNHAEGLHLESAGGTFGLSENKGGNHFYQTEAFVHWNLPWRWGKEDGLHAQTRLGVSAGWLHGWDEDGFIGTAGPALSLGWKRVPVFVEGGFGPTFMSRDTFGAADFGSHLQFTTYGGLTWACGSHLSVGCRYQHMSNGRLAKPNPGLNLHAISIGWRF